MFKNDSFIHNMYSDVSLLNHSPAKKILPSVLSSFVSANPEQVRPVMQHSHAVESLEEFIFFNMSSVRETSVEESLILAAGSHTTDKPHSFHMN